MHFLTCVVVLVAWSDSIAQSVGTNIFDKDSFPPNIKSVTIKCFALGDESQPDSLTREISSTYMEFVPNGKWSSRIVVFADGDVSYDSSWYDKNTRTHLLRRRNTFEPSLKSTAYNPDGTVNSIFFDAEQRDDISQKFDYDKQGRLIHTTETFTDQEKRQEFTYNKAGLLERKTVSYGSVLQKKQDIESEQQYFYNTNGQRTQVIEVYYGAKDVVRVRDTVWFVYDSDGRIISQTESRQNGEEQRKYTYAYDSTGRMIEKTYAYTSKTGGNGYVNNKWEYDKVGYCSYSYEEGPGYSIALRWKITYNEQGLPVLCYYSNDAEVFCYRWEYEYR